MSNILVRPIFSEKSLKEAAVGNYTFEVGRQASKPAIKRAFKETFNVDVEKIKTLIVKGRSTRVWGQRKRAVAGPKKKAVVSLQKGQKLDVFEVKGS